MNDKTAYILGLSSSPLSQLFAQVASEREESVGVLWGACSVTGGRYIGELHVGVFVGWHDTLSHSVFFGGTGE